MKYKFIYGSKWWIKKSLIQSAKKIFMKYARGCTKSDEIRNGTVRSDLNMFCICDKTRK